MNLDWQDHAACKGMDTSIFFPEGNGIQGQRQAQAAERICAQCPVVRQCAQFAKDLHIPYGVFGGRMRNTRYYHATPIPALHGTEARARKHYRDGEQPCPLCMDAASRASEARAAARRARGSA